MSTRHDGTAYADPNAVPTAEDLMMECAGMEVDLGRWLAEKGRKLTTAQQVARIGVDCHNGLHASGWRALVLIWCTSPEARGLYSEDARGGLFSAATSMDDVTLVALVRGLLEEAGPWRWPQRRAA